ncbi:type II toxin-antitoxin system HicA family toxin [Candidatus Oscillochloris fontis]|uniref:type II toxin-antitoxin system HicA family toxin n=1 Tax=Candidatus Oscillochloris fontis TaxID=2496868 RepID=UPI00101B885D|nr:type II toxin-antitoxin system HicA family toxin [Candidatus Oscillochloris fontis]
MKRTDLLRHLERYGCLLRREGGRHSIYINPDNGWQTPIPRHREIPDLLAKKICRDLEIPEP